MGEGFLDLRRKGLEESYFAKENERLIQEMKKKSRLVTIRKQLEFVLGRERPQLVNSLMALDITKDTLPALIWLPLVLVAWSDGYVDPNERQTIFEIVNACGIRSKSSAENILEQWLINRPKQDLIWVWKEYIRAFKSGMADDERPDFNRLIYGYSRNVAMASGSLLKMGAITTQERKYLKELEQILFNE